MNIPFFKPEIDETTIAEVAQVLRSGWLTSGPRTEEFERMFAAYVNAAHAVMLNSCTAALHLCLAAIDLKRGDEVILPTYTFAATAEVVEYFDATPVLVDIHDDTMNMDERLIAAKITPRTRAIMPVHFAGQPCEMDAILDIARHHDLWVFEDAAHVTPASYRGKPIGSLGDATCFSFYANKCITTGEGGMVTTNDAALADRIRILRLHGMSRDAIKRYAQGGSWRYDIVARGYKYNPTDIAAAMGICQLRRAGEFFNGRKRVAARYQRLLGGDPRIQLVTELNHVESSWHVFPIRLRGAAAAHRDAIIDALKAHGIATSVHFIPLHLHSYYRTKYGYRPEDFPQALDAFSRLISLPVYPGLSDDQVDCIVEKLLAAIDGAVG